jgi:hypothetical protein
MNVDLHSFKESNDENDYLIVPFNGLTRGKGGILRWTKFQGHKRN